MHRNDSRPPPGRRRRTGFAPSIIALSSAAAFGQPCDWHASIGNPGAVGGPYTGHEPIVFALRPADVGDGEYLHAGGEFERIGGVQVNSVARWDGQAWRNLGRGMSWFGPSGFERPPTVRAIAVYDDGGGLSWLGGTAVGRGYALAARNGDLYVAGEFDAAGGVPVAELARWDGTSWSDVSGGVSGTSQYPWYTAGVWALAGDASGASRSPAVGGFFHRAGDVASVCVARLRCAFGDTNCDGALDNFDIDPFVALLVNP